jgi:hypothetical protein
MTKRKWTDDAIQELLKRISCQFAEHLGHSITHILACIKSFKESKMNKYLKKSGDADSMFIRNVAFTDKTTRRQNPEHHILNAVETVLTCFAESFLFKTCLSHYLMFTVLIKVVSL